MSPKPGIGASQVTLRPIRPGDSDDVFNGLDEEGIETAVPGAEQLKSPADARKMIIGLIERALREEELHLAICLGGNVVGMCALYDFRGDGSARVGYWIGKNHRGRGLAKSALTLLVGMAFGELGLKRLSASISSSNSASSALLLSLGFQADPLQEQYGTVTFHLKRGV